MAGSAVLVAPLDGATSSVTCMSSPDGRARWEADFDAAVESGKVRDEDFTTLSGDQVAPVYGPPDGGEPVAQIGWPGQFPFTRGLHPSGYRGRLWTIRQFAGFGNAEQTNGRFRDILAAGGGGLSVAFDMPTLMGRDSDDPLARGEVGHCGVAIDSARDMDVLFAGIPLADVTTSMTISGPAVPIFAMYVVAAERQGADISLLDGTLQTDIFKEYTAQKEWLFGPEPHLRLIGDLMEWVGANVPKYKPLSVSGYHIREAGSTAAQELAFTLADASGTSSWACREASMLMRSHPACRSSSTRTSTSSRRSPSSGPPGASGPAGCATSTAPRPSAPSGCGSTPRPPA